MDVRKAAQEALAEIADQTQGHVYASRRGIVAGIKPRANFTLAFRMVDGRVRLERWNWLGACTDGTEVYELPRDLEREAALMLAEV